jgi:hypothetical protein
MAVRRFATEPYTNDPGQIGNNFVHLTNFSINKESDKFVHNVNPEEAEVTYPECVYQFPPGLEMDPDQPVEAPEADGNREGPDMD